MLPKVVNIIKKLLFPPSLRCPLCGREGHPRHLCNACLRAWSELGAGMEVCRVCGRFGTGFGVSGICPECVEKRPPYVQARGVAPYEGPVRNALHAFKFSGRQELAYSLGELMAGLVADLYPCRILAAVIPVPLHPVRAAERRFDQAELLAGVIASHLRIPLAAGALRRIRETPSQTTLGREDRLTNPVGAFAAGEEVRRLRGKGVLLVDDVFTTGATVGECCRILRQAGIGFVYVVTLATGFVRENASQE